eukprot:CAMPEP_0197247186 /NCGR_PEP_ID=MMETSP1429-20130617/26409_1 /TAXON_ID=49237 /ORGANISM="Chaetoceros  sp., Strain UNC1202" /LENGTH=281 /DNA_ID=CAMNT_0042708035 /DNA_START=8 /DNA_END=853 /DNA_ORIENTATION=+
MMNHPLEASHANASIGLSTASSNDLQFKTSVDTSIQQNVQVPSQPPTLSTPVDPASGNYGSGDENGMGNNSSVIADFFKNSGHPISCIFHILFKALAVVVYLLGGMFQHSSNFITVTVICLLLLAADFWVVKNITGRLLVGLRWWAQIEGEDGTETRWIFESAEGTYQVNKFDEGWFWTVLYVTPLVWGGFLFIGMLKWNFGWMITVSFALALSIANVYGYWQCSKNQKAKFQQMVSKGAQYGAGAAIRHNVFGYLAKVASGAGTTPANGNAGPPRENMYV